MAKAIAEFASKMHPALSPSRVFSRSFRLGIAAGLVFSAASTRAGEADCRPEGAEPAEITAITRQGGIRLRDGRELKLAHLLPADGSGQPDAEFEPGHLETWLSGQRVGWKPAGEPDRWGRIPANLFLREPSGAWPAFWLQAGLAQHGWAALWPGRLASGCLARLLAAERRALVAGRGIWAPDAQDLALAGLGRDPAGALGRRIAVILRVRSVRNGRSGSFVNFVPSLHGSPALFLTTRQMEALRHAQRDPFSWQGKRVLLRFVVHEPGLGRMRIESIDQFLPID